LKDKKILEAMACAAELSKSDIVLEIGPGTGTLTEVLARYAKKVIAVEKDRDLIPALREKLKSCKNVEIIEGDILKISDFQFPIFKQIKNYKIVANLPYYITSRFLRLFLSETKFRTKLMVLMIQKEVAERIMARGKHESLLSLSVKVYGKPEIIKIVPRGAFSPPPKVDSAIIKISNISDKFFTENKMNPDKFFEILRLAFQKKRKMLRNSIFSKSDFKNPRSRTSEYFAARRPEELSLEDWAEIISNC